MTHDDGWSPWHAETALQNVLTLVRCLAQWIGALNGALVLVALTLSRTSGGRAQE